MTDNRADTVLFFLESCQKILQLHLNENDLGFSLEMQDVVNIFIEKFRVHWWLGKKCLGTRVKRRYTNNIRNFSQMLTILLFRDWLWQAHHRRRAIRWILVRTFDYIFCFKISIVSSTVKNKHGKKMSKMFSKYIFQPLSHHHITLKREKRNKDGEMDGCVSFCAER